MNAQMNLQMQDQMHARDPQKLGRIFGWAFLATFLTSIPAYFVFYADVLENPGLISTGADPTGSAGLGAVFEVLLIVANVATGVLVFPILRRYSEVGAISYVAARILESVFIAIGVISLLAFLFMRQEGTGNAALGEAFVAIYDRSFLLGPGFMVGVGNGLILGYLMYRTGLVPRGMAVLGLIGGPALIVSAIAIMLGVTERGGAVQAIATIPEAAWELSLIFYCIVKGFRQAPILSATKQG